MLLYLHILNDLLLKYIPYAEVTMSGEISNTQYHDHPDLLSARPPDQTFPALTSIWRLLVSFPTNWLLSRLSQFFRDVLIMLNHRKENVGSPEYQQMYSFSQHLPSLGSSSANQGLLMTSFCQATDDPIIHFP